MDNSITIKTINCQRAGLNNPNIKNMLVETDILLCQEIVISKDLDSRNKEIKLLEKSLNYKIYVSSITNNACIVAFVKK